MKAEMISVSNDLLNGRVRDQNIAFLAKEFAELGIQVNRSVIVADDKSILKTAIQQAEEQADFIVLVGGLGPDKNDITKQVLSGHLEIPLVLDQISEDKIITYHKNSKLEMPDNNQLQAMVIQDSTPIRNETGLATGMFFEHEDKNYLLLPGPFDELEPTFEESARPLIIEKLLADSKIETRVLRIFGLSEAQLKEKLDGFIQYEESPFVGIYPQENEFEVRITVQAKDKEKASQEADAIKEDILNRVQDDVYGEGDKDLLETVKDLLIAQELTITAAESLTGGAFLSGFASQESASAVLPGGIVTYSTDIKNKVLGVPKDLTDEFGVVSSQCAIAMAEQAKEQFQADMAVSLTGVAGPSSLEGELPGTVWIGLAKEGMTSFAKPYHFAYKRNKNRDLSVLTAVDLVRRVILEEEITDKVYLEKDALDEMSGEERE